MPEKTDGVAPMGVQLSLVQEIYDVSDAIVKTRAIQAFDHAAKAYPIHRIVRCAVRRKAGPVFDDLALQMGCTAQRMGVEKVAAFHESWNAMFLEACRASLRMTLSPLWWTWPGLSPSQVAHRAAAQGQHDALAILARGLDPIQRRATANAKRLRRA